MVEKSITLTGSSANSIEDAVNLAVSRAAVTIEGIRRVGVLSVSPARSRTAASRPGT
ncbi:MAG: dodecin family protein [Candidatus Binatia bacterium]